MVRVGALCCVVLGKEVRCEGSNSDWVCDWRCERDEVMEVGMMMDWNWASRV